MRHAPWIVSVAVLVLAACGGGGGDAHGCNQRPLGACAEYADSGSASWSDLQTACEQDGGVWGACPAADRAGACALAAGGATRFTVIFYAGYVCSAEEGQARCDESADSFWTANFTAGAATCGTATAQTLICDMQATGTHACATISGAMEPERVTVYENACAKVGTLTQTACPTAGALGTCTRTDAVSGLTTTESYYAGADVTTAASDCTDAGGTWTTPPPG